MPFPALAILAGLASATGTAAASYGLGKQIKDNNKQKKLEKMAAAAQKKLMKSNKNANPAAGNQAGFIPGGQPQGSFWGGQPAGLETFNQYTPEQQQALSQVLQQSLSGLGKNQFDFAPIEQQAREGFEQKTIPSIAERFSSLGSGGSQGSSAFGQQLGAAGAGLETELAAMKQDYGLRQQQMLHELLGIGLKPQFESLYRPGSEGFGKELGKNLIEKLMNGLNGENIMAGVDKLKDWRNKKNAGKQDPLEGLNSQPGFKYKQPWTTLGGSTNTLFNPSNIVPGIKKPGVSFVPKANNGKVTNMAAANALYGLK